MLLSSLVGLLTRLRSKSSYADLFVVVFQHFLITVTKSTCFCVALTKDEYDHVHNDIGLDDLEVCIIIRSWNWL